MFKAYIVDASGFINGFTPLVDDFKTFTVPGVLSEIEPNITLYEVVYSYVKDGFIFLVEPKVEFMKRIEKETITTGDAYKLSDVDKKILALGLQLNGEYNVTIVTDDYAIQNTGLNIGINVKNIRERGVSKVIRWVKYCPSCFREYTDEKIKNCIVCGRALKLKPSKRTR